MTVTLIILTTVLAGLLGLLLLPPGSSRHDCRPGRVIDTASVPDRPRNGVPGNEEDLCLLLDVLAALLAGGVAVPRALEVTGRQTGITAFVRVSRLLLRGVDWDMAWKAACAGCAANGDDPSAARRLEIIADLLAPSWNDGTAAAPRLRQAARNLRSQEEDRLARDGSVLSVRILLPVGLCFLPALVVLGVIPVIASFALA
jgi:hypothetical protein